MSALPPPGSTPLDLAAIETEHCAKRPLTTWARVDLLKLVMRVRYLEREVEGLKDVLARSVAENSALRALPLGLAPWRTEAPTEAEIREHCNAHPVVHDLLEDPARPNSYWMVQGTTGPALLELGFVDLDHPEPTVWCWPILPTGYGDCGPLSEFAGRVFRWRRCSADGVPLVGPAIIVIDDIDPSRLGAVDRVLAANFTRDYASTPCSFADCNELATRSSPDGEALCALHGGTAP